MHSMRDFQPVDCNSPLVGCHTVFNVKVEGSVYLESPMEIRLNSR
jgi:hypothetical protein